MVTASQTRGGIGAGWQVVLCAPGLADSEDSPRCILHQTQLDFLSAAAEPFFLKSITFPKSPLANRSQLALEKQGVEVCALLEEPSVQEGRVELERGSRSRGAFGVSRTG